MRGETTGGGELLDRRLHAAGRPLTPTFFHRTVNEKIGLRKAGGPMGRVGSISVLVVAVLLVAGCTTDGPTHKARESGSPSTQSSGLAVSAGGGLPSNVFADACAVRAGHPVSDACSRGDKVVRELWQRPLHLPKLSAEQSCPTTHGRRYSNQQFAGVTLGTSPVRPLIATPRATAVYGRPLAVYRNGWWSFKTLWFALPRYRGPFLIRGANLVTGAPVWFGESPQAPALAVRARTINGDYGFREAPGGTYVKQLGCYGWQVDGIGFSRVIVFQAHQ